RRIVFRGKLARPQDIQLVAIVHHDINRTIVPGNGWLLTKSGNETFAIRLLLVQFVLIELPDAPMSCKQRTGILSHNSRLAITRLAGIRRRSDIHIQRSLAVERNALIMMLML